MSFRGVAMKDGLLIFSVRYSSFTNPSFNHILSLTLFASCLKLASTPIWKHSLHVVRCDAFQLFRRKKKKKKKKKVLILMKTLVYAASIM